MSKQLKIMHVLSWHPLESAGIFSKRQIRDLEALGHINRIYYLKARFNPFALYGQYRVFKKQVQEFNPDIIHAHYGTITAFFASCYRKKSFVVSFQGSDVNKKTDVGKVRNWIGRKLSAIAASRASLIFCVSDSLKQQLTVKREEAIVLPSGINMQLFHPIDQLESKEKLGLHPKVNYVFFNANNPDIKRLDIAQRAVEQLIDLNVELLSLSGAVAPDEIPYYLNACCCLLLCSDNEGSPMVVKEAMACDLPIVSVNVGDVKERIEHVSNCFIVEQDADVIAHQIRFLVENGVTCTDGREQLLKQGLDSMQIIREMERNYFRILGV